MTLNDSDLECFKSWIRYKFWSRDYQLSMYLLTKNETCYNFNTKCDLWIFKICRYISISMQISSKVKMESYWNSIYYLRLFSKKESWNNEDMYADSS